MTDVLRFNDRDGVAWSVEEEDGEETGARHPRDRRLRPVWLRFLSDMEVRTLWTYPDDWVRLEPFQLQALLDRASTIVARFPRRDTAHLDVGDNPAPVPGPPGAAR